ncbi:MAG TPA: APC family permease [Fimbriimonadaceae bacterium]|jgi:amino acid transporter
MLGKLLNVLLGPRRTTSELEGEKIGVFWGVPTLGLDALSSAAYGPEAALTVMLGAGLLASQFIFPIFCVILALLTVLFASYLQTISAYPGGGGSYTVASENLGPKAGLFAAASLLLDYILTAAVGISAGIEALDSAFPQFTPYTIWLCLGVLLCLLFVNLRGIGEAGRWFATPTYIFVVTLCVMIGVGLYNVIASGGHPHMVQPPAAPTKATEAIGWWLLIRAFASGCTAMTGVEAVSNGVLIFKKPGVRNAKWTLGVICLILGVLLAGIALLAHYYGVVATSPDSHYESILSQLIRVTMGRGWFYYLTIMSILAVLCLSANTAFADFPRLCQLLARDQYLPMAFADLSRRLVFAVGVSVLTLFTGILLVVFGGITDRLIPLYAVGAFLAFTFSQAGMVVHWVKHPAPRSKFSMVMNGAGCIATGFTVLVIFAAKFVEGAWISFLIIFIFFFTFLAIKRLYTSLQRQVKLHRPAPLEPRPEPLVVLTMGNWNKVTSMALNFGCQISREVFVLHISTDEAETEKVKADWEKFVVEPTKARGGDCPQLDVVTSPYREINKPLVAYVNRLKKQHPHRDVAVVMPELISTHWWSPIFQRHWGSTLKKTLLEDGDHGVVLVSVPWHLK